MITSGDARRRRRRGVRGWLWAGDRRGRLGGTGEARLAADGWAGWPLGGAAAQQGSSGGNRGAAAAAVPRLRCCGAGQAATMPYFLSCAVLCCGAGQAGSRPFIVCRQVVPSRCCLTVCVPAAWYRWRAQVGKDHVLQDEDIVQLVKKV